MEQKRYLTVKQLADLLQVPPSWVYERTCKDEIPHFKLGKLLRFDPQKIEKWMQEQARG